MKKTLQVLNALVQDQIIRNYAIGGAMGAAFYIEPVMTVDLDVFVFFRDETSLSPLEPVYATLRERGYTPDQVQHECVQIEGIPVQFLPVHNELLQEAMGRAQVFDYDGVPTQVLTAEDLVAIALQTGRTKDFLRVTAFVQASILRKTLLNEILTRHHLFQKLESPKS